MFVCFFFPLTLGVCIIVKMYTKYIKYVKNECINIHKIKIKVVDTSMDDNEAWIGLREVFAGLGEKGLRRKHCRYCSRCNILHICEKGPDRLPLSMSCWVLESQVAWIATILPIFNQAFYKPCLLTPQADCHILGGYLIPSLTFFTWRVLKNRWKTRKQPFKGLARFTRLKLWAEWLRCPVPLFSFL